MNFLEKLIKQIQKDIFCPVCGKKYVAEKIHVRGFFNSIAVIQVACEEGHSVVFIANFAVTPRKSQERTMSLNDSLDLHNKLKNFDGDFEKQWK